MRSAISLAPLDPASAVPRFAQLATAIADDVRRGRLAPGDVLPGTRALAASLGVNRDTVQAAYAELEAQGWIVSAPRRGTVVAQVPEHRADRRRGVAAAVGFRLDAGPPRVLDVQYPLAHPPGVLAIDSGAPDARLAPAALLGRAYRRALRRRPDQLLRYAHDGCGHPRLRDALARQVRDARGIAATRDELIVTRGSQMALDLIARTLVAPGDVVAVEALGYRRSWTAFERAGATLVGVPVDAGGLDVDALARLAQRRPIRAVYVTPHHQYPTTAVLGAARRVRLLDLARRHRWAIVEDDYDHELQYSGRPVLPLASADRHGVVLYVGTLSKVLAPGVRVGFVVAPRAFVERLGHERCIVDRQGDLAMEVAIADLIEDDELGRHVRKMRRVCLARRDAFVAALARTVGSALVLRAPPGGMALWAAVDPAIDIAAWYARGLAQGVAFAPGQTFALDARAAVQAARFGFAALTERELAQAAMRLAAALPKRNRRSA